MEHGGKGVLSYPLSSPAALDPPVEWDRLRRDCPVAPITFPSGDAGSLPTRYDDVKQVLSDPRFTRALDAPDAARDRFAKWSDMILNLNRFGQDEVAAAMGEFWAYISEHLAAKRAEPGEDILSALITATDADGEPMSDMVLAATGIALLVAGHETTANMIGKMVAMLLADQPKRWEDPKLVRTAVEETPRMDANSGLGMVRYLPVETEVAGTVLPKGTTVLCGMAAANRDASVFDDAEELDITRSPNTHLSFGVGPHSCLGQALARTELQVVLEVLLRRLPTLELAVRPHELDKLEGLIVGGLTEVPVRW